MNYHRAKETNDFYETPVSVAMNLVALGSSYIRKATLVVDAGAGRGALTKFLPRHKTVGVEMDKKLAKASNFVCRDFLRWMPPKSADPDSTVVVTNPPFNIGDGSKKSGVVEFCKHAAAFASTIVVLAPYTHRRIKRVNEMPRMFHMVKERDFGRVKFCTIDGKCRDVNVVGQVWVKRKTERKLVQLSPLACDTKKWGFVALKSSDSGNVRGPRAPNAVLARFHNGDTVCQMGGLSYKGKSSYAHALARIRSGRLGSHILLRVVDKDLFTRCLRKAGPTIRKYAWEIFSCGPVSLSQREFYTLLRQTCGHIKMKKSDVGGRGPKSSASKKRDVGGRGPKSSASKRQGPKSSGGPSLKKNSVKNKGKVKVKVQG